MSGGENSIEQATHDGISPSVALDVLAAPATSSTDSFGMGQPRRSVSPLILFVELWVVSSRTCAHNAHAVLSLVHPVCSQAPTVGHIRAQGSAVHRRS